MRAAHLAGSTRAAQNFWRLPERDLARLLVLTGQIDRLELKVTVPPSDQEATCVALGLVFPRTPAQHVYYLDTPDRALHRDGVILRARRIPRGPDDSVVKLRPLVPGELPARLRDRRDLVVEVDGMPGQYVCSGAIKARRDAKNVKRAVDQRGPLRALFTKPQLRLLATRADNIDVNELMLFGPVLAYRRRIRPDGFDGRLLAERWVYPDGSRILELSTRCAPGEALRTAAGTAALMRRHGIDLTWPQQTKTHVTLDFFARQHRAARPPTG
ncbi:CYTH domain-containing protein [Frankia canadensis]|uniref:CYTH domain-containing protein n=1 Tax=Frankia canadensis TaxID=1836972 RepID=A0A2I2KP24_9ACTN|nr:adenylate cyclase [Frankia canadensis]SNQ47414.1 CYTH domain-containing protein [Frankia canadensis]SOU54704.1 CYTH domain-containing protein [Frankia canadensis]